ncbi:SKU5 similar 3 [Actinidia rufa]|uniref:SKU5 similar 3 n=1 Tax=Actinidia rufa TaxID=165716 RepID=A0A7J0HBC3_9ERIC|nr:SKU5 similar 3 [Actinidia rufa]
MLQYCSDKFPGPILNVTTDWNIVVNVENNLDKPFLLTCYLIAGMAYNIGRTHDRMAFPILIVLSPLVGIGPASGYGGIIINNTDVIPLPFSTPDGDITLFINDWYIKSHKDLRKEVERGTGLGAPDGILFNGLVPYRYDQALVPDGIPYETINVELETEGSYTVQQNYANMDIHCGQSFLVTMDQNASSDSYIVASSRWNVSAGAACPNPQGSFKYGDITVTEVFVILNRPAELLDGKWLPSTPLKLAQQFNIPRAYKVDFPNRLMNRPAKVDISIINGTYTGSLKSYSKTMILPYRAAIWMAMHSLLWGQRTAEALATNGMGLLASQLRKYLDVKFGTFRMDPAFA